MLANRYLSNPIRVKVGQVSTPTANVAQSLEKVTEASKVDALLTVLLEELQVAQEHQQVRGARLPSLPAARPEPTLPSFVFLS